MVTNRKLGCCDDIYSIRWLESVHVFVEGTVTGDDSSQNEVLSDATIQLELKGEHDTTYVPVQSIITDKTGKYRIEISPLKDYRLIVKHENYLSKEYTFSTRTIKEVTRIDASLSHPTDDVIQLKNVYYEYGSAKLSAESKNVLDTTLLRFMINNPAIIVEMGSHTDNIGNDRSNQILSQQRAESVVNYLVSKGIERKRLKAKGYGESRPIAANQNADGSDNPEGRQLNRRTEFKIVGMILHAKQKEDDE